MSDNEKSNLREKYPSGWLALTQNESASKIIDALLDFPPHKEFNQTELAEHAGVSRQSVNNHINLLLETKVIKPTTHTTRKRYNFNPHSEVSKAIIKLDGAMNRVVE